MISVVFLYITYFYIDLLSDTRDGRTRVRIFRLDLHILFKRDAKCGEIIAFVVNYVNEYQWTQ